MNEGKKSIILVVLVDVVVDVDTVEAKSIIVTFV